MGKFTVEICRTAYAVNSFDVEADTKEEAVKKAIGEAVKKAMSQVGNVDIYAEYNVEHIEEHKED